MTTYILPKNLGDILGAHHDGNFQTVVAELKADVGVLIRGTVLSEGAGADAGKLVPVAAGAPGNEAAAYGVLLDAAVDTAASTTGSIARSGTFRGASLIVGIGADVAVLTDTLRQRGIFVEGPIVAPTA